MSMRKDPSRAQGHRQHMALELVKPTVTVAHPPPPGLLPEVEQDWADFWRNGPVQLVNWEHHKRAFMRLFELYSLRIRLERAAEGHELVRGSKGQDTLNPALRHLASIDDGILSLEQEFGLTPRSSVRLGVQIGGSKKTLEDLNRESNERDYSKRPRR